MKVERKEERKRKSFHTASSIGADWRLAGEMAWGALAKWAARKQAIKEAQPPCETLSILCNTFDLGCLRSG
jgi:hypothetical protein